MIDLVQVRNVGHKPLVIRHHKGDVTIDPGHQRTVPSDYAHLAFGDPSVSNANKSRDRDEAYKQVRTTWGFYPGLMPEAAWEGQATTFEGELVGPFKPQAECYDLDNNRLYMLMDDPTGALGLSNGLDPSKAQSDAVEASVTNRALQQQAKQIDELKGLVEALLAQQGAALPGSPPQPAPAPVSSADFDPGTLAALTGQVGAGPQLPIPTSLEQDPTATPPPAIPEPPADDVTTDADAARAEIPAPPDDEPESTTDTPRATRVGPVGGGTGTRVG